MLGSESSQSLRDLTENPQIPLGVFTKLEMLGSFNWPQSLSSNTYVWDCVAALPAGTEVRRGGLDFFYFIRGPEGSSVISRVVKEGLRIKPRAETSLVPN